jgi:hypothetical protein
VFPVFSKSITNLKGMGIGSRVLHSAAEDQGNLTAGHMWMPLLHGRHVSSDVAVVDGIPCWWRHVTGTPSGEGTFDYWTVHAAADPLIEDYCGAWIRLHLSRYTSMVNIETIGGRMIEVHLRLSDQWPDLYGAVWVGSSRTRIRVSTPCRRVVSGSPSSMPGALRAGLPAVNSLRMHSWHGRRKPRILALHGASRRVDAPRHIQYEPAPGAAAVPTPCADLES